MTKWFILIPCHLCDLSVECCVTEEFLSKTKRPPAEKVQRSAGARTAAKLWFHLKWMRQHLLKKINRYRLKVFFIKMDAQKFGNKLFYLSLICLSLI